MSRLKISSVAVSVGADRLDALMEGVERVSKISRGAPAAGTPSPDVVGSVAPNGPNGSESEFASFRTGREAGLGCTGALTKLPNGSRSAAEATSFRGWSCKAGESKPNCSVPPLLVF
eukprot:361789-Pyramimonas_sp.AAC.1